MKTQSKVKSVQASGTWNSKDGKLYYKFEYEMEDGKVMTASHTSEKHLTIGEEVEYEITKTNEYGNYGKVYKVSTFNGGTFKQSKPNNASFALAYAKDLCVGGKITIGQILEVANKFNEWLDNPVAPVKEKPAKKMEQPQPAETVDDLPF